MTPYEIVAAHILAALDRGTIPWRKPWRNQDPDRNLVSGHLYRGVNRWLCAASSYPSPYWLTFRQATEMGGGVRAGEKATPVVFWSRFTPSTKATRHTQAGELLPGLESTDTTTPTGPRPGEISTRQLREPIVLRYYHVFNLAQVDIPADKLPAMPPPPPPVDPIPAGEAAIGSFLPPAPTIAHGGSRAYYSPSQDAVQLPPRGLYASPQDYYHTAFHELAHATGHSTRLGRKGITEATAIAARGETYAREELVAEMAASYVCGSVGLAVPAQLDNAAAYIAGWRQAIRSDPRCVTIAAAQAEHAADWIMGRKTGEVMA